MWKFANYTMVQLYNGTMGELYNYYNELMM